MNLFTKKIKLYFGFDIPKTIKKYEKGTASIHATR